MLIKKKSDLSYVSSLICDIFAFGFFLSSVNFNRVNRSANTIVHQLAHLALVSSSSSLFMTMSLTLLCFPL